MNTAVLILLVVVGTSSKKRDFFNGYEEVFPSSTPESLGAIPKCGDGDQKGKFICVPYFNCDPFTKTVIENPEVDGSNRIKPRIGSLEPRCDHFLEVCCRKKNIAPTQQQTPTIKLDHNFKCGPKNNFEVAIIAGKKKNVQVICEGTLLSPVIVLTAAHCLKDFKNYQIRVRARGAEEDLPQEKGIAKIVIHEHYMTTTLYNDIALLFLNSSLSKIDNLGSSCIPYGIEDFNQSNCFVGSWDQNDTQVVLISHQECQNGLREILGQEFILDHSFTCTETVPAGKGGGSLICPSSSSPNHFYQVGITSWGEKGPGVYTNTTLHKEWIDYKVQELGYNIDSYTYQT